MRHILTRPASFLLTAILLAGCAGTQPIQYQGLASASQLATNRKDETGHLPFAYTAPDTDWHTYNNALLDPVAIYEGPDQQFGDTSAADKKELAAYMQTAFAKVLKAKYGLTRTPAPGTLRIHLTLTGVETSTPVLSTLTKLAPAGLVINTVQSARDKQASFTGSVTYAAEIYDSVSGRLLRAYVSKQYPFAENVAASFGTLDASKSGIRKGADLLVDQLHEKPPE